MKTQLAKLFVLLLFVATSNAVAVSQNAKSTQNHTSDGVSIYSGTYKKHASLYRWMWGEHYRSLYYMPVEAPKLSLKSWSGGMTFVQQMPNLYGLLFMDAERRYFLFKILGTPTSFVESSFFKNIYDPKLYKDTYLGNFIEEAVTIENPFGFVISDNLAQKIGLNTGQIRLFEVVNDRQTKHDEVQSLDHKLASIYRLPDLDSMRIVTNIDTLLTELNSRNGVLDKDLYLKTRMYDMLIGDWDKIPENWGWVSAKDTIDTSYKPMVLDRSHAFTKVDGVFFKRLLGMLGLSFITNYEPRQPDITKINKLGYTLDVALTAESNEQDWVDAALYIQQMLTDSLLQATYLKLPQELQVEDFKYIVQTIKTRRDLLPDLASEYYRYLQKRPVLVAHNRKVEIENQNNDNLLITMRDKQSDSLVFRKTYSPHSTKQIWLYAMGGDNEVVLAKTSRKIPLKLIDEAGTNNYRIEEAEKVKLYAPYAQKQRIDSLSNVKTILSKDSEALRYDYQKYQYSKLSFMPIGVYDSDLGVNIGTSASYTIYGLRRKPFTSQHQLSYNYSSGLTYQGIFPIFNTNNSFHLLGFVSNRNTFVNYFGMGNETDSFGGKNKRYNRVHYDKYMIAPSYNMQIDKNQELNLATSFQLFKLKNPKNRNRYINTIYADDNEIFRTQKYIELYANYHFEKSMSRFLSSFSVDFNPGLIINADSFRKNVPYAELKVNATFSFTDRLSLVTMLKGKALFSNSYTFYQAATTDLRGFRDNRFIGKQSFYECTDLRLDMGRLANPFTPTSYGLFAGIDHGRVWYPDETSDKWYASFGGGFWLTVFKKITGKFSYFASNEHENRFIFELGLSF